MAVYNSSYTGAQHDTYVTKQQLIDLIYPIGSYYISDNSVSPATRFGGTWEQIKDRFILAAGDTYTGGDTGGTATHTHSFTAVGTVENHTLTIAEMPRHLHQQAYNWTSGGSASASGGETWAITMTSGTGDGVGTWPYGTDSGATQFGYTGGGDPTITVLLVRHPQPNPALIFHLISQLIFGNVLLKEMI